MSSMHQYIKASQTLAIVKKSALRAPGGELRKKRYDSTRGRARGWLRRTSRHHDIEASRHPYIQTSRTVAIVKKNRRCARLGGKLRKQIKLLKKGGARARARCWRRRKEKRRGAPPWRFFDAPYERAGLGETHQARRTRLGSFRPEGQAQVGRSRRARREGDAQV